MSDDYIERCYICLEKLNDECDKLKCGCFNRCHTICLDAWITVQNKCPICKQKIIEMQTPTKNYNFNDNDNEEDNFELELELDDNDIFYNPLVYFVSVYIVYFIVLFLNNSYIIFIF
jgi:hypothetical protein